MQCKFTYEKDSLFSYLGSLFIGKLRGRYV